MVKKKTSARTSDRRSIFAGVDAGGSHSEVVIVDSQQRELSRIRGGPAALRPDNAQVVARTIAGIVRRARGESGDFVLRTLVIAAAGAGRAAERAALETAIGNAGFRERVRVVSDAEGALESAFPGAPGIILTSGTGSIAYGRDKSGTVHRVGGLGWQLGDEGSGYSLGRAALGACGRAADGRGPATILTEMALKITGAADLDGLIEWAQTAKREDVAALARVVAEAATGGDKVAKKLLEQAADDLVAHVTALVRRMAPHVPDGIALAGGLLGNGTALREQLTSALRRAAPGIEILERTIDPALGAASIATRL